MPYAKGLIKILSKMEKNVNEIVGDIIVNPELNELAPLKGKGFWKEQMNAIIKLVASIADCSPHSGVANFIEDELSIWADYKLNEFFRKFTAFVMELTDISTDDRVKFSEEIQEKAKDYSGNIIMGMVDRLDNINKERILASLTKAKIHGFISIEDYFRLSSMLERIPFVDLVLLQNYKEPYYDESGDSELLYATGALELTYFDAGDENKYVLSKLGKGLLRWGMQITVEINKPKGTGIPVASEETAESLIEELT